MEKINHGKWIKQHNVTAFFVFTFAISWIIWISVRLCIAQKGVLHLLYFAGVFGPFLAAIIVTSATENKSGLWKWLRQTFNFRINIGWYLLGGLLGPISVALYQFSLYMLLGGEFDFSKANPWWNYFISVPIGALFAGGNEEPGRRGFALPHLLKKQHPLVASLFLGIMWLFGIYHLLFQLEGKILIIIGLPGL